MQLEENNQNTLLLLTFHIFLVCVDIIQFLQYFESIVKSYIWPGIIYRISGKCNVRFITSLIILSAIFNFKRPQLFNKDLSMVF